MAGNGGKISKIYHKFYSGQWMEKRKTEVFQIDEIGASGEVDNLREAVRLEALMVYFLIIKYL